MTGTGNVPSVQVGSINDRFPRDFLRHKVWEVKVVGVDPSLEVCVVGAKQAGPEEFVTWALSSE